MASDIKIDDSGNIVIENGDLVIVEGDEEIAQRIESRFRTQKSEWYADRRLGFPTVGKGGMFDSSTPLITRLAMCRKYLGDTRGVVTIIDFIPDVETEEKSIGIKYKVMTENSTEITGEVTL